MLAPLLLLLALRAAFAAAAVDPEALRCLVCRVTIDEFESAMLKLNPKSMVEIGNYRLDELGTVHQNKVPLSKSQVHLSEMLDDICKKLADYARVRYKATKKLAVLKLFGDSGGMNPEFSYTDFVTDEDLNKSLEFYCEGIIGENEDAIVDLYTKRPGDELPDGKEKICKDQLQLCEDWMVVTDEDRKIDPNAQGGGDPYGFGGMDMSNVNPFDEDESPIEELEEDVGALEMKPTDKVEL